MTRRQVERFFNTEAFRKDDNNTYWERSLGYILFNKSIIVIHDTGGERPELVAMQSYKDTSVLLYDKDKGVFIGSHRMERENGDG